MRRICALIAAAALLAGPASAEPVRATVETGTLVGEATERAAIFRNIPYAAAPVDDLRWAPPRRATAWTGARPAVEKGPSCPQPMNRDGTPNFAGANGPTSEDCLQLNVYAPRLARKAPVMVWLHGGGNRQGAGWIYDGQAFARDGVVLVTVNYRLGPLGWFSHPAITRAARPGEAANFGLMDQMAALAWVKRNIAAFGGDPANVTLFGESAGAANVLTLLAAPSARKLFSKAIVQSGGGWGNPDSLATAEAKGAALASAIGLPGAQASLAQLRAVPAQALIDHAPRGGFDPVVDGRFLPRSPSAAMAAGQIADVPLIVGANSGEDSLMAEAGLDPVAVAGSASEALREAYAGLPAGDEAALGREIYGDRIMVAPARWTAAKASGGKPAWLYHFTYVGSRFRARGVTRAAHAAEIQYVFEYWGRRTPIGLVSDDDKTMAALMHGCWVAFARSGAPACGGMAWPPYDPARDLAMIFGGQSGVAPHPRARALDAHQAWAAPAAN